MNFINLTPHAINLNNGATIAPSGTVARVTTAHSAFDANGICIVTFGEVQGLPAPEMGTIYIVSALVAQAAKRPDVVSPATGHPDCRRVEEGPRKGQILSVPGFVRG
jgi:hypothetical protein